MKDQSFSAVQESQAKKIPIEEIGECTQKQRSLCVNRGPKPASPLDWRPGRSADDTIVSQLGRAGCHLVCCGRTPACMANQPDGKIGRNHVDQVSRNLLYRAVDDEMLVVQAILASALVPTEQTQVI